MSYREFIIIKNFIYYYQYTELSRMHNELSRIYYYQKLNLIVSRYRVIKNLIYYHQDIELPRMHDEFSRIYYYQDIEFNFK